MSNNCIILSYVHMSNNWTIQSYLRNLEKNKNPENTIFMVGNPQLKIIYFDVRK